MRADIYLASFASALKLFTHGTFDFFYRCLSRVDRARDVFIAQFRKTQLYTFTIHLYYHVKIYMYARPLCAVYVCGPLCPFLLCQAVFHFRQACSYNTYKCSNNTNNNLSLVQHFQTSSIHRQQDSTCSLSLSLPLISHTQWCGNHFCIVIPNFTGTINFVSSVGEIILHTIHIQHYICSAWCQ